jgi:methylthioribose-1-phosphate isomerase
MRPDQSASYPEPSFPVAVAWGVDGQSVRLLDQTLLPEEERYLRLATIEEVAEAIRTLRVRGAPAIGIAAAMGLATVTRRHLSDAGPSVEPRDFVDRVHRDAEVLRGTRPTAVNLGWALDRLEQAFSLGLEQGIEAGVLAMVREAEAIASEDRDMCRLIGEAGAGLIPEEGCGILTHCNAGALATGGIGTALAPVYVAHARGIPVRLFADETRPLLQGARLTAWEAGKVGIPVTLITDGTAASVMAQGLANMVIVGADRVAANGDVANKIGTYGLALLARAHGIPFYVALPRSTFDLGSPTGLSIPIEERDPSEVTTLGGRALAPPGVSVKNPAFDRTPAHLVTAFITDGGILRPPFEPRIRDLLDHGSS